MQRRHYSRAPIVEATISFGVILPAELTVEELGSIRKLVQDQYPNVSAQYLYTGELSAEESERPQKHRGAHEHIGYGFQSHDGQRSFTASLESFEFTLKGPYDRWESFRDEARGLWYMFKEMFRVKEIVRVAVRYINRIDIDVNLLSSTSIDLEDYVRVYPEIPDDWPSRGPVSSFFLQFQMWQSDLDCMLIVNEAPGKPPRPGVVSLRLDFDLFKELYEKPWKSSDDGVWQFLEKLHERKNDVFEASITNATRRLIK